MNLVNTPVKLEYNDKVDDQIDNAGQPYETIKEESHIESLNTQHQMNCSTTKNYVTFQQSLLQNINTVPQNWIDIYHSKPINGNKEQIKNWLVQVMATAEISNKSYATENIDHFDPVAVKEEFIGMKSPRFTKIDHFNVNHGNDHSFMSQYSKSSEGYRQYAEALGLQVNTDGVGSVMSSLGSNGSIITPF